MEAKKQKMSDDVVELNVGGTLLTTLMSTLITKEPKSKLADMLSGREEINKDKNGRYFLDCDGEVFKCILDFLRFDTLPRQEKALEVYDLAKHFKIQSLVDKLRNCHTVEYRMKIDEIRKYMKSNGDTFAYEEWKKRVVEDIRKNPYFSPREDIYLYETSSGGGCDNCPLPYAHIFLHRSLHYDEHSALLLYDLCELGYGKFTVIKKILDRCSSCNGVYKGKQLILRKH